MEKLLTRKELAEAVGVTPRTVDRWREQGIIKSKRIGGVVRFTQAQVNELLGERNETHHVNKSN